MKLIIKFMLLFMCAALAAPLFIAGPDGKPLLQLNQIIPVSLMPEALKNLPLDALQPEPLIQLPAGPLQQNKTPTMSQDLNPTQPASVYRWQDAQGNWHYSDKAPAHTPSESVTLRATNTLPAYNSGSSDQPPAGNRPSDSRSEQRAPVNVISQIPDTLSPADAGALLEQARETQRILQERQAQIDALLKQQ